MLRTKVVCTLGPASSTPEVILEMVKRGMDLARVNMSHGSRDDHRASIAAVRAASAEIGRPVGIMVDLSGPKIRVGELKAPVRLEAGQAVVMAPEESATGAEIPTTYAPLAEEIQPGDQVLLDDGLLELVCAGTEGERTRLEVVRGGLLKPRKGINLPLVNLRAPSLTEKDLSDLDFALEEGVEYIALSFVRRADDVVDLKGRVGNRALVVSKIEKVQALRAIEEILAETDAVMVARGDLGVELPFERVPIAQKRIIQLSNFYARPVITATQMLESMIEHTRPTRAEASDVANAILDGTDAVMLSGETAVGNFPLNALEAIVSIGTEIERSGFLERGPRYLRSPRAALARRRFSTRARRRGSDRGCGSAGECFRDHRAHQVGLFCPPRRFVPADGAGLRGDPVRAHVSLLGCGVWGPPRAGRATRDDLRAPGGVRTTLRAGERRR